MGKIILGVTISLDGFAEDHNADVGALFPDLSALQDSDYMKESIRNTGAVVMAWKEYAMADDPDWYAGNYEYQVPIFVVTDKVPERHPKETGRLSFTFVTGGIQSALCQAKTAAKKKDVTIIGSAGTTQQCLNTGLVDELHVDIIPLFLNEGFRPFENIKFESFSLERLKTVELPEGRTHLRFKLVKIFKS